MWFKNRKYDCDWVCTSTTFSITLTTLSIHIAIKLGIPLRRRNVINKYIKIKIKSKHSINSEINYVVLIGFIVLMALNWELSPPSDHKHMWMMKPTQYISIYQIHKIFISNKLKI